MLIKKLSEVEIEKFLNVVFLHTVVKNDDSSWEEKVYFESPLLFVYPLSLVILLDCLYIPNNGAYGKNLICECVLLCFQWMVAGRRGLCGPTAL